MTPEVTKTMKVAVGEGCAGVDGLRYGERRGQRHRAAEPGDQPLTVRARCADPAQPLLRTAVEQRGSGRRGEQPREPDADHHRA